MVLHVKDDEARASREDPYETVTLSERQHHTGLSRMYERAGKARLTVSAPVRTAIGRWSRDFSGRCNLVTCECYCWTVVPEACAEPVVVLVQIAAVVVVAVAAVVVVAAALFVLLSQYFVRAPSVLVVPVVKSGRVWIQKIVAVAAAVVVVVAAAEDDIALPAVVVVADVVVVVVVAAAVVVAAVAHQS